MNSDDVWNFILGIAVGVIIGALITVFSAELTNRKFCPTCGSMYGRDSIYCEDDGTLLKERGN